MFTRGLATFTSLTALLALLSPLAFATPSETCASLLARLSAPKDPEAEKLFVPATRDMLVRMPEPTPEMARERNLKQLQLAREVLWARPNLVPGRATVTSEEAQAIFDVVKNHPVTSLGALPNYDPMALLKFCYGRAVAVQLEAVVGRGLAADSVRKVWAVGNLTAPYATNFHVASMLKGPEGKWFVIDINQEGALELGDWLSRMQKIDNVRRPNMEILFTNADRLLERRGQVISPELLANPSWRGYFDELLESYKNR